MRHIVTHKYCTICHRNTARSSTELRQNASNVAAIGGNQAGGGSCQWECQEEPTANFELVPTLKIWQNQKVSVGGKSIGAILENLADSKSFIFLKDVFANLENLADSENQV